METLNVFLRGQLAGELSFGDEGLSFSYKEEYLKDAEARKLSSSLPLEQKYFKHQECQAFFSGLLPDGKIREALAQYLQISETNIFGLLKAIGGECAGAISLHSPNKNKIEQRYSYKILESKAAQRLLSALDQRPFLVGEEGLRMSAGGAQSKLMVSFNKGQLALPLYDTPSTHILKPAMKGFEDSVFNEFFCMQLAQDLGLKVPSTEVIWIENSSYYLIERYDRRTNDSGETERLHQEDFCQALNIPPELKYENEGGPSLVRSMCLVDSRVKQGLMRGVTKIEFLRIIIFNYLTLFCICVSMLLQHIPSRSFSIIAVFSCSLAAGPFVCVYVLLAYVSSGAFCLCVCVTCVC